MKFFRWLFASVDSQRERVRKAVRRVANAQGDVVAEKHMVEAYREEAGKVDPYTDWMGYAELRQAQAEYEQELAIAERRLSAARAHLTAQQLKLEKMK